jgi:cytochrome c oxidase subunit 3
LSPAAYSITAWIVIAGVVMMFAALSSAYIILSSGNEVPPVSVPRMFYASTVLILASSFSFAKAHRSLRLERVSEHRKWLLVTLVLGFLFLGAQLMGWRELAARGVFFATHPHSSFFYLFTGLHGVHLMGGMLALIYLVVTMRRSRHADPQRKLATTQFVERYWHAMDGIWIWLFGLLLIWA